MLKTVSLRDRTKSCRGNPMNCIAIHQRHRRCNGLICYHFRQPELFMNLVVTTISGVGKKIYDFFTGLPRLDLRQGS